MIEEMSPTAKIRVGEIQDKLDVVELTATDSNVERMVQAYRDKFGLGPRDVATERAEIWRGATFEGRVVAVYAERWVDRGVELTDAYFDDTIEGKVAFATMAYGYRAMLASGKIDQIVYNVLQANREFWQAVERETGDEPAVRTYIHRRKG